MYFKDFIVQPKRIYICFYFREFVQLPLLGVTLNRTLLLVPVQPAARVLSNIHPAGMLSQSCSRLGPHARLAVEHEVRILGRAIPVEKFVELFIRDVVRLDLGCDRNVDSAWDLASVDKLVWLADIYK